MPVLADGVGGGAEEGGPEPIPPTAKMLVFHSVLFPSQELGVNLQRSE
jgi:hypothetical protein